MTAVAEFDVRRFMSRPEWFADAQCRGLDPSLFLPVEDLNKPAGARILAEAREVCRRCDVQAECLAYALNGRETGIWAGTTGDQRRRILGAQNRRGPLPTPEDLVVHEHGTPSGYRAHRYHGTDPCAPCRRAHADEQHHERPSRAGGLNR